MKDLSFKWFSTLVASTLLASSLSLFIVGDRGSFGKDWGDAAQAQAPAASPTSQSQPVQPSPANQQFQRPNSELSAARSGGRAGGGSFSSPSRSTSPSRPSGGYSNPGGAYPSYPSRRPAYGGGPVIVPVPVGPPPVYYPPNDGYYPGGGYRSVPAYPTTTVGDDGSWIIGLIILLLLGTVGLNMVMVFIRTVQRGAIGGVSRQEQELYNDTLTVSKVQVALLAQARTVQAELNQLADELNTDAESGLMQLMQESALALLRTPENWSHALVSSATVKGFEQANALFSQLSVAERSKYKVETLTNVGGRRSKKTYTADPEQGPASYLVITLLIGTAHDNALFESVHSIQELQQTLEKIAAIPAAYLKVFEIIWTPQDPTDTLSYDDLLTQYPDMIQL